MPLTGKRAITLALCFAAHGVLAQSLIEPRPVERLANVVQFGVPGDSKFIICDGADCPQRSRKFIAPTPELVVAAATPIPTTTATKPSVFSSAKAELPHSEPPARKKHNKPKIKYDCKPVSVEKH